MKRWGCLHEFGRLTRITKLKLGGALMGAAVLTAVAGCGGGAPRGPGHHQAPSRQAYARMPSPAGHGAKSEPTSWGGANLISYADSDFESGIGSWVPYFNTTLEQDSNTAFAHDDSLKMTAGTAGSQAAELGRGRKIRVLPGATYRESGWFKAAAAAGRSVTFADAFYKSNGRWLGWFAGRPVTLNRSGAWQYASALITAPGNAAYMLGSPRVSEAGVASGEALLMDEVLVEPYRAATLIGAKDPSIDGSRFDYANAIIGPLQVDKVFYDQSEALPQRYGESSCSALPASVTCVLAYKVPTTDVASFVSSIPAGRNTIMVWHQEPENDSFPGRCGSNGSNFVCDFERQADLIRANTTASNRANVWIADDALTYQYDLGTAHDKGGGEHSCSYTVPSRYVDFYLADVYEDPADGTNLGSNSYESPMWQGWLSCVLPEDKPIGLAEYGLNCSTPPDYANAPTTSHAMAADNRYLRRQSFIPAWSEQSYTRPVVMWEYWWWNNVFACQFTSDGNPDGRGAVRQWRANEIENGGGFPAPR